MENKEIESFEALFKHNLAALKQSDTEDILVIPAAICATVIDVFKPIIEEKAKRIEAVVAARIAPHSTQSLPTSPEDNSDPEPLGTSVCKTLGSLGLQSLADLKGFQYDAQGHILLHVKGRMADSGWLKGNPRLEELKRIMNDFSLPFEEI